MLRHYVRTAVRHVRRHPGYTALNVGGLGVGLACAVLVGGYVRLERSFDRFHARSERTYRVVEQQPDNEYLGTDRFAVTPVPLAGALLDGASGVEAATALGETGDYLLRTPRGRFVERGLSAEPAFFRVFDGYRLARGDTATALAAPGTIVLTETLARKLFGADDPLGQTVGLGGAGAPHRVTGVVADPPPTSHLTFAYLLPAAAHPGYVRNRDDWTNHSWYTYVVLRPGASAADVERRMEAVHRERRGPPATGAAPRLSLQPLTAIHLGPDFNFDLDRTGDARLVALFAAIAVVVLVLATVNYANLAVARSARRAREVGLRKVVGARRGQIAAQQLAESVLTALLALGVGLGLARLLLPAFAAWMGRDVGPAVFGSPLMLAGLAGLALGLGLVAGAYPALVLTAVAPSRALRGSVAGPPGRRRLRSLLVVGQYAAATVLVAGSLVIYRQMQFVRDQPLGFDRAHVVTFTTMDLDGRQGLPGFAQEVRRLPGVVGLTASSHLPTDIDASTRIAAWEGRPEGGGPPVQVFEAFVDDDFLPVYGIALAAGRGFSAAFPADTAGAVVLNETAARAFGWTAETAVGKTIARWGGVRVVGVVRDFHLHSLHRPLAPLLLYASHDAFNQVSVRVRPERLAETLAGIEAAWARRSAYPFAYRLLDDEFDRLYRADAKLGQGVAAFTLVALLIACLGLFGLATDAAARRTKEVGIRKVLGASAPRLVALLTRDFLRPVVLAVVVAAPVAYVGGSRWLETFAYRVPLGPGVFVAAGTLALAVAALTVSLHTLRAAHADPVRALRAE